MKIVLILFLSLFNISMAIADDLRDLERNLPTDMYQIYEKHENGKEDYLCIIYVLHKDGKVFEIEVNNDKDENEEKEKYYAKMKQYFKEVAQGKHKPIALDNLGEKYRIKKHREVWYTRVIHLAYYDNEKKQGQYLGYMLDYSHRLHTFKATINFLHDDEHKKYVEEKVKDKMFFLDKNYVYLERPFGDELYYSKREKITLEELNKYNMDERSVSSFFHPMAYRGQNKDNYKHGPKYHFE